jgi:hypothetical protein
MMRLTRKLIAGQARRLIPARHFAFYQNNTGSRIAIDTRAVRGSAYRDLELNEAKQSAGIKLDLPGYGHRIFLVEDRQTLRTEENR